MTSSDGDDDGDDGDGEADDEDDGDGEADDDDDVKYLVHSIRPAANFCVGREIDGTVAAPAVNTLKISVDILEYIVYSI